MAQFTVFGFGQIVENDTGGHGGFGPFFNAESFQIGGFEMAEEQLVAGFVLKLPVVDGRGVGFFSQKQIGPGTGRFREEHLRRLVGLQYFFGFAFGSLKHIKLAGGNVDEGQAHGFVLFIHRSQPVVFAGIEHIVAQRHAGCDQFGNPPFHNSDGIFRVFELVADRHPLPGTHQFGQVIVERMMRKSGQGHFGCRTVSTFGEGDVENAGRGDRVLAKGFIKIAHPKEQQSTGIFGFDGRILLHERGFFGWLQ